MGYAKQEQGYKNVPNPKNENVEGEHKKNAEDESSAEEGKNKENGPEENLFLEKIR